MRFLFVFFIVLFIGCGGSEPTTSQQSEGEPYEARCAEPLPTFTLGPNSHPTKEQEQALCACIWQSLGKWEREVSEKIAQGKESEVSESQLRAFIQRFGNAVEKCGGEEL